MERLGRGVSAAGEPVGCWVGVALCAEVPVDEGVGADCVLGAGDGGRVLGVVAGTD